MDNYFAPDSELDIGAVINSAAATVMGQFRRYVEYDDLVSIGWLWVIEHPKKLEELKAEESVTLAAWKLDKAIWKMMERYARKERAEVVGYKVKDEMFYSTTMIEAMLERVFTGDAAPDKKEQKEIRVAGDPAEGGDYLASWLDVQRAWKKARLTDQERTIVEYLVGVGASQTEVAAFTGLTRQAVSRGHDRAIRKLQKYLGGPPVGDCPYSCECHEGRLRQRPGTKGNDAGRNQLLG